MFTIWLNKIWLVTDLLLVIFSLPTMRDVIKRQGKEVWKRSVNPISTRLDMLEQVTKEIIVSFFVMVFSLLIILNLSEGVFKALLDCCKGTLIAAFLPSIFSFVNDSKNKEGQVWNICCIALGIIVSIVAYIELPNIAVSSLLMAIFVSTFVMSLYKAYGNGGKKVIKIGKGIRKDLYNRTSSIDLNMSTLEMIRKTEGFVEEYLKKYKRLRDLEQIEYVTLLEAYAEEWYKRAKRIFLIFICATTIICLVEIRFISPRSAITGMALMIAFVVNIIILKAIDKEYLHRMAIRFCYSEWGYCLYYPKKCKFVASVQLFEFSKNCRYIHALLDYMAFIRIVYTEDSLKETQNIKMLSKDMALLYRDYEEMEGKLWLKLIPLWIVAFLEYLLSDKIELDVMIELKKSVTNKKEKVYIKLFLKSFVVDFFRRMPNEEDRKLVNEFIKNVEGVEE